MSGGGLLCLLEKKLLFSLLAQGCPGCYARKSRVSSFYS